MNGRIGAYVRQHHLALLCLFLILGGGTAWAVERNSVKSNHIVNGQVKTPDLAKFAVKPAKLAPNAVRAPHIDDGAISEAKLATDLEARIADLEDQVGAQAATNDQQATTIAGLKETVESQQPKITALQQLLAGVTRETVGGHSTLRFSSMNLQLVNGTGTTGGTPNGLGNLLIGYNAQRPAPASRTGSHYLVVGDRHQWTMFGGIVGGFENTATGQGASVLGGTKNTASGTHASVLGGGANTASGLWASVSGGDGNSASGDRASASGGLGNDAQGDWSSVSGGQSNDAGGNLSSVSGGVFNAATGFEASILGGSSNTVGGVDACHPSC